MKFLTLFTLVLLPSFAYSAGLEYQGTFRNWATGGSNIPYVNSICTNCIYKINTLSDNNNCNYGLSYGGSFPIAEADLAVSKEEFVKQFPVWGGGITASGKSHIRAFTKPSVVAPDQCYFIAVYSVYKMSGVEAPE